MAHLQQLEPNALLLRRQLQRLKLIAGRTVAVALGQYCSGTKEQKKLSKSQSVDASCSASNSSLGDRSLKPSASTTTPKRIAAIQVCTIADAKPVKRLGLVARRGMVQQGDWVCRQTQSMQTTLLPHAQSKRSRTRHKRLAAQHVCGLEAAHHASVDQQQRLARLVGPHQVRQLAQRTHCTVLRV